MNKKTFIVKTQQRNQNSFASSIEENETDQRAMKANQPFALLSKPQEDPKLFPYF